MLQFTDTLPVVLLGYASPRKFYKLPECKTFERFLGMQVVNQCTHMVTSCLAYSSIMPSVSLRNRIIIPIMQWSPTFNLENYNSQHVAPAVAALTQLESCRTQTDRNLIENRTGTDEDIQAFCQLGSNFTKNVVDKKCIEDWTLS